jgi:hypothetical protein
MHVRCSRGSKLSHCQSFARAEPAFQPTSWACPLARRCDPSGAICLWPRGRWREVAPAATLREPLPKRDRLLQDSDSIHTRCAQVPWVCTTHPPHECHPLISPACLCAGSPSVWYDTFAHDPWGHHPDSYGHRAVAHALSAKLAQSSQSRYPHKAHAPDHGGSTRLPPARFMDGKWEAIERRWHCRSSLGRAKAGNRLRLETNLGWDLNETWIGRG